MGILILLVLSGVGLRLAIPSKTQHPTKEQVEEEIQKDILPQRPQKTITNYFPSIANSVWTYQLKNKDHQFYTLSIDYIKDNIVQMRYQTEEESFVKVYVQEEDSLFEVATVKDDFIKNDYTLLRQYKDLVLRLPVQQGQSWGIHDGGVRTIVTVDGLLNTDLGELEVIEIETNHDTYRLKMLICEKIGIAGWYEETAEHIDKATLKSYTTDRPITIQINAYYGNTTTQKLYPFNQTIQVMTNEEPKHFLTDILKTVPDERYIQPLPIDVYIKSIYVEDSTAHVELDDGYDPTEYTMLEEKLATKSVVKTIGNYYGVDSVIIYVDGTIYKGPIEVGGP